MLQLIESWDQLFKQVNTLKEEEEEEISDISIIKTKNEGEVGENK